MLHQITPGWLSTYGTAVIAGRDVDERDAQGSLPVALVNEAYARKFLLGRNPNRNLAFTFRPMQDRVNASLTRERLVAWLAGFFGALALLLAALGLYGVTSYAVTRRRAEIGIRMALGAEPAGVLRLVLGRVVMLVALGVIIGTAVSVWSSPFIATLLYELQPRDGVTLVTAAVTLTAVGAIAGWLPAHRASRIDPTQVLRDS